MARLGLAIVTLVALTVPAIALDADPLSLTTYSTTGSMATLRFEQPTLDPSVPSEVFVSFGAEPTMLVDSLGRALLIGDEKGVLRSTNGGLNWQRLSVPYVPGNVFGTGIFDGWSLAQDAAGKIYASTTDGPIINVATSVNGGASWETSVSTYAAEASALADRPWLLARNDGQVVVSWNNLGQRQQCAYSTDGALTFTARTPPLVTNALPIGGPMAWDNAGRVVFAAEGGIGQGAKALYRYDSSPCSTSVRRLELPAAGPQLSTAVVADGAGAMYTARPNADATAMLLYGLPGWSTTGMKTLAVSMPTLKGNTFGTIARAADGEIAVTWYGTTTAGDFQSTGFNGQWHVYTARVSDFWSATPSVTLTQVTSVPNHVGHFCMQGTGCDTGNGDRDLLDYFQTAYDAAGNLHIAYGHDGATSTAEVRYSMLPNLN